MFKKFLLFTLLVQLIVLNASAQTLRITGRVIDDSSNAGLANVSVVVVETKNGVSTDANGNFSINVTGRTSATISVSYVGYRPVLQKTNGKTPVTITLGKEESQLDDVVVVGYSTVRRRDLTGAVSSVNSKQIRDVPLTSAAEALTGRLAGVQVTTSEGSPGADVIIRVRGGGSITQDNSPIYIVDGVQVENALQVISPQDIASVDVLKDASTTAIYGARGANGVVIITTKGGRAGKTVVSYNGSFGWRELSKKLDVLRPQEFVQWQYERALLANDTGAFKKTYGWDTARNIYPDYSKSNFLDWQERMFGEKAGYQNHNVSVSGGNAATTFNLSLTANREAGILLESGFNRNIAAFRLDHRASDKFRVGFNVRYLDQTIKGIGTTNSGTRQTNRLRHAITYRPLDLKTTPSADEFDEDYFRLSGQISNPVLINQQEFRRAFTTGTNVNGYASYRLIKNLTLKSTIGYDVQERRDNQFFGPITGTARNNQGFPVARVNTNNSITINWTNTLQYSRSNLGGGKHDFDVLLGQEIFDQNFRSYNQEVRYLPMDITAENVFARLELASPPSINFQQPNPSTYISPARRIFSLFGRANYTFNKKFTGTVTLRSDRSSKFAYEKGALVFPSGQISYRFSKEKFMDGLSFIDDAKIRVGFGIAGNNRIGDLLYLQLYNTNGQYALNNVLVPGYNPSSLANFNLQWEKNYSTNVGLDLSMFKNKIQLTIDAYKNTGKELLLGVAIPATSGYTSQIQNLGFTSNKGIEFQIVANPVSNKNFSWTSNFNVAFNKNRVESLGPVTEIERTSGWQGSDGANDYLVKVGEPIGLMYGFKSEGWYTVNDFDYNATTGAYTLRAGVPNSQAYTGAVRPGTQKFTDVNGDGFITFADRAVIGDANPDYTGGWNNQFTYKNFDMSIFFNWVVGNDVYNANKIEWTDGSFPNTNLLGVMRDRWTNVDAQGIRITDPVALTKLNANAKTWSPNNANRFYLTNWAVEDGSFLRVNNITVGYTLPKQSLQRLKISSLRVFGTVNNLATLTNYSGYDPEVSTRRGDPLTPGVDFAGFPRAVVWVFGTNINF